MPPESPPGRDEMSRYALLQHMPGFVGVLAGPNHIYEYVNDAYVVISGPRSFVGRSVREVFPELEGQGFFELLDRVYATGEPYAFESMPLRLIGEDSDRYIDFIYQPIRGEQGVVTGIFVAGYDTTEHVRALTYRDALVRFTDRISDLTDPEEITFIATEILGETLKVSRASYGAIDPGTETLHVKGDWNAPGVETLAGTLPLRAYGDVIDSLKRGEFVSIADVERDERTAGAADALKARNAHSFLNVPVLERGRLVAVLSVNHGAVRAWTADDHFFIKEVAARARTAAERIRNERELRELNATLRERVETASRERERTWQFSRELLVVASPEGALEALNPAWTKLLGWDARELIGANFAEYIHPDDWEATHQAYAGTFKTPLVIPHEHRVRHKDGSYRWFAWTAAFEDGRFYASGRDVTHDREREAILKDTQDFARLALSAVGGVGVWTYEVDSDLFMYDNVIADLYGLDPAKGPGGVPRSEFLINVMQEDRAALTSTMSGGLKHAGDLELEYRIRHPDGRIRWVLSRGHTYHDKSGTPVRRTGVGVETTNQRVTEEALRQSQKMEAVGQLTGGVAHDFNNLLMVIKASGDMLKRPNLSEERRDRYIKAISETVDRAAKLTGQLLAFARRQALQPEVFAVSDSVRAIGEMLGTLTGQRIEIVTSLPEEICWINTDPSQFDTALVNMAVNARDAMNGEGRLTITVAPVETMPRIRSHSAVTGSFVMVSMADTGGGIPPEQIEKIFEPFFTTKGVGRGTGLGLSQVFGFVKQSGGEVDVASEVGQGTTFTLYLPRVAEGKRAAEIADEPEPLASGHGTCVLVVEDNSDIGIFATQTLAELGYLTVLAANAEEALTELADDPDRFDVVFTDILMPGISGIELAQQIRRQHRELPVVLTSGYSHALAQSGTHGFELLQKPYSVDQLSRVLRKVARWRRRNGVVEAR